MRDQKLGVVACVAKENHEHPGTPHSPSRCRARELQQKKMQSQRQALSEWIMQLRMRLQLCGTMVENYRHATLLCWRCLSSWFKLNWREFHLTSPFPLNPAQLRFNPHALSPPSASMSLHSANLTRNLWVIDCLIHCLSVAIHDSKTSRLRAIVKEHSITGAMLTNTPSMNVWLANQVVKLTTYRAKNILQVRLYLLLIFLDS